ncbi:DMT family transporter [Roseobacter sp. HKCCA0434]|uniref:DMT family transporter n=1 Tax=Roseobacter sp. HKCCA0434 TaxID=3079297 RepID=UPI002905ADCA|nr:DMT family transporter [Roseobacter sp. HKCCA0434]
MRLFLATLAVLVAFAANSVLTRAGLADGAIAPAAFAAIRLASGALVLGAIVALRGAAPWRGGSAGGAASLLAYAVLFSFAYVAIPAGLGALILFGAVQVTMFAGAILRGERPGARRWIGSGLGLAGLAVLGVPGAGAPPGWAAGCMALAGVAWGLYSLIGARAGDATRATAGNFLWAAPVTLILWALVGGGTSVAGVALAVASGAVASGLGYAAWYAVLPRLDASVAALAQLTVPLIALAGGMAFLGEAPDLRFAIASVLILGGVGLGLMRKKLP